MRHSPWYQSLYLSLTDKTRQRDLRQLRELNLVVVDSQNRVWPGFGVVEALPEEYVKKE